MNDISVHTLINFWRGMYKALEKEWQNVSQELGLTTAEQHMLMIIYLEKEIKMSKLAEIGLWDISTVVQVANRLKQKGYIKTLKYSIDRRVSYCILTEEGESILRESTKYKFKTYEYIINYGDDKFLETLFSFDEMFNEHFHGKEFVDWIKKTTILSKSLKS